MNVNAVVDRVQFHKPECPSGSSPWNATLYFQSTPDGIAARHILLFELIEHYKTPTGAAANISMGFDRCTDRALTKELAEWVELPSKERSKGKGKGDASSSGPKRRSPEHGNGSRGARQRQPTHDASVNIFRLISGSRAYSVMVSHPLCVRRAPGSIP
ncbi:unnamed protein product, partial [Polarella glacialis]